MPVTSYKLRVESLKAWVETQNCEFKSTSYEFKSTSYEIKSTCYEFKSTSYQSISTSYEYNWRVTSSSKIQVNVLTKLSALTSVAQHKKWSFPLRISSDLVTFTEEIRNGKLHFLCSVAFLSLSEETYKVWVKAMSFILN